METEGKGRTPTGSTAASVDIAGANVERPYWES